MGLKLEVIKAGKGDCLLLHYGKGETPALTLIDGGPPGVYKRFLKPRLEELREERDEKKPLELELVMVSHIDQDHVWGVWNLLQAIELADKADAPYKVGRLWHNGFKELADDADSAEAVEAERADAVPEAAAVVASVGEGVKTNDLAAKLDIPHNERKDGDLILAGATRKLPGGLMLTAIGPSPERVENLRKEWAKTVKAKPEDLVPAAVQETIPNLSSLLVLAEYDKKRILLTGDGVAGDILDGLRDQKLLDKDGRAHFEVLKMPHHGSDLNVKEPDDFLEKVTADHYVISGNGEDGNPEPQTLRMIAEARKGEDYEIWLTYREGEEDLTPNVKAFLKEQKEAGREDKVHFPEDGAPSMTILLD
ncbi:MAG TPA: MBL fold metallo-hydrolase [Solirubrobacterales bacterium]